jgi:PmbA protein
MNLDSLAIKKATALGASEVEVYTQKTQKTYIEFSTEIETFKTVESVGIGLRLAVGKKLATYATSILNEAEIDDAVNKAVKIAKTVPEDANWKHFNTEYGSTPVKGIYDKTLEILDYETLVKTLNSCMKTMTTFEKRVKPTRGFFMSQIADTTVSNNHGEANERKETNIEIWIRAKASEGGYESTGNEDQQTRFWKDIDFDGLSFSAAEKAVRFLKAKPIPSTKTTLVVRNQVFANIVGLMLGTAINADWVQKGRSPLADKLGKQVASEKVTAIDDGAMERGYRTRPFDDEGHPTQTTRVIEEGVLKNYLYDSYTALKGNVRSTGNASRSNLWTKPQPAASNLQLDTGNVDTEEILQDTKNGIYIDETIGEWLSNPVSGNLNATITHGYLVKNGELGEPVKGIVVSGSFYELLETGIEAVGNDMRNRQGIYSPTVKLKEVAIAGE